MSHGVESSDLTSVSDEANNVHVTGNEARDEQSGNLSDVSSNDDEDDSSSKDTSAVPLSPSTIKSKRKFIDKKLSEHRQVEEEATSQSPIAPLHLRDA